MDPLILQLAALCSTARAQSKWVIVPSLMLGHMTGERLVRSGVQWANLRFTTPDDLARGSAEPVLSSRGTTVLSEGTGPHLIMRLLLDLPATVPIYFRRMAHHPPMAEALWRTLTEIRMAGLTAKHLNQGSWSQSGQKVAEFTALVEAYERYIQTHHLADRTAIYQEALAQSTHSLIRPEDSWLEWPHTVWAPLQRQFLDTLPGRRLLPAAAELPGLVTPRRVSMLSASVQAVPLSRKCDCDHFAYLLRPEAAPSPKKDGSVSFFRAGSRVAEIEEIFRRILAESIPLDDVEIAGTSSEAINLLWEKAQRDDWPLTVGPGLPVTLTRPGRAVLAFCEWIEQDFPAGLLRRLLQSGDVSIDENDGPTAGQAARLLAQSAATWGRDTYTQSLSALGQSYRIRALESEGERRQFLEFRAGHIDRLQAWISRLMNLVPLAGTEAELRTASWIEALSIYLSDYVAATNALDDQAITALSESIVALSVLESVPHGASDVLTILRGCVSDLNVGAERAQPGHLYVTTVQQAGYSGRLYTFLFGIEESAVLPGRLEDAILLDDERAVLHPLLATSQDRVSEGVYHLVARLATLSGRVSLSFACYDTRAGREIFPSWVVLQAWRVLHPSQAWTYQQLTAAIGPPLSLVPSRPDLAVSRSGWWLSSLRGRGIEARGSVLQAFPDVAAGAAATAARLTDRLTPYDGWVPEAGPLLNPLVTGKAMSPTSLEKLAACAFRHFLQQGLNIQAMEGEEPTPDAWLDPMTRGSLLHQLYADTLREQRRHPQWSDTEVDAWVQSYTEHELDQLRTSLPAPSEEVYGKERDALLKEMRLFLQFERRHDASEPIGFEVAFGLESTEDEEGLSRPEAVIIPLGAAGSIKIRGRIDRIDRLPDGTYEVIDYKTGSVRLTGGVNAVFAGGRQLQHALYALAATELLKRREPAPRVSRSVYYFPTARGKAERIVRPIDRENTLAILHSLTGLLQSGTFVQTTEESECRFCDYQRACGTSPFLRASVKVNNEQETLLAPYRKLAEHA